MKEVSWKYNAILNAIGENNKYGAYRWYPDRKRSLWPDRVSGGRPKIGKQNFKMSLDPNTFIWNSQSD